MLICGEWLIKFTKKHLYTLYTLLSELCYKDNEGNFMNYESDNYKRTLKTCAVCGIQKPLRDFIVGTIDLSSMSHVKKYSDICTQCRNKNKSPGKSVQKLTRNKRKKEDKDDDEDSGGGKRNKLTIDYNALLFAFSKQKTTTIQTRTIKENDRKRVDTQRRQKMGKR